MLHNWQVAKQFGSGAGKGKESEWVTDRRSINDWAEHRELEKMQAETSPEMSRGRVL